MVNSRLAINDFASDTPIKQQVKEFAGKIYNTLDDR